MTGKNGSIAHVNRLFEDAAEGNRDTAAPADIPPRRPSARAPVNRVKPQPSEILDRQPPSDKEAEMALLGSMLRNPAKLAPVAEIVTAHDFYHRAHAKLYEHLVALGAQAGDTTILVNRLREAGDLQGVGGTEHIGKIWQSVAVSAHAVYYAKIVRDLAVKREAIEAATASLQDLYSGQGSAAELTQLAKARFEKAGARASKAEPLFSQWTCAELVEADLAIEYLIEHTLVAGQPAIVAGTKKGLKTSLVIEAGISLATGSPFLGLLEVPRAARVGIMSGESGMATIRANAHQIAKSKGFDLASISGLIFSDSVPKLADPKHLAGVRAFCESNELEVLVLDPTYLAMPGADAGNLFIQGELLRGVSELCQSIGATLILVHHTRKNPIDPFAPPELEDIAWAGFQEWARQWLLVGRREKYVPGSGEHRLWLNCGGSAGHSSLWALDIDEGTAGKRTWTVKAMHADEARQDAEARIEQQKQAKKDEHLEADRSRICKALAKFPGGETAKRIREAAGLNPPRFGPALASLIDTGDLVPCTVSKSNRSYEGYLLAEGDPQ